MLTRDICVLAWLLFSGKKHDVFQEADELVAIIYDAADDGLEGSKFAVEQNPSDDGVLFVQN